MDKIKMSHKMDKTFEEGFEEYVLDMKARNLRQGTLPKTKSQAFFINIIPHTKINNSTSANLREFAE